MNAKLSKPDKKKSSIVGIGIDIEEISRFRELPYEERKEFYTTIFTEQEIRYCLEKRDPYPHFAVRFCAKEAFFKASPRQQIKNPLHIEIVMKGRIPQVRCNLLGHTIHLSMSHANNHATAIVLIENI